jgi:hypothetical protein
LPSHRCGRIPFARRCPPSAVEFVQMMHQRTTQMAQHKPEDCVQYPLGGFRHGG